ncbi:MAG: DNA polymerase III subunit delta [Acidobacteriota bacterium]
MASLTLAALKQQIADRKLAPLYLFVGEDVKLMDRMVDGLEEVIDPADRPFAVERFYGGEAAASPEAIADAARIMPMLGDRRLVFVLRAERLLKPKRASKAAPVDEDAEEAEGDQAVDGGPLEDYFASPVPSTTIVFVATEVDKARRLTKRLLEAAKVVDFAGLGDARNPGSRGNATDYVKEELTRAGRSIAPDAARMIVERSANDITKIRADVERLLLFAGDRRTLTIDDVREVVSVQTGVDDEWAINNALSDGNASRALMETGNRFDRGDSPHAIVGQLRWWVANKLAAAEPARVKPALDALLRTDLALKSSGGDERILVERLVVELTGRPLPAQRGRW